MVENFLNLIAKEEVSMFSRKKEGDGKTGETAGWLDKLNLPTFMEVGGIYQVVDGPILLNRTHCFCSVFQYRVRRTDGGIWDIFYVDSTLNLPKCFLVRKIIVLWMIQLVPKSDNKSNSTSFLQRHPAPA